MPLFGPWQEGRAPEPINNVSVSLCVLRVNYQGNEALGPSRDERAEVK